jgi:uncharacterized protein
MLPGFLLLLAWQPTLLPHHRPQMARGPRAPLRMNDDQPRIDAEDTQARFAESRRQQREEARKAYDDRFKRDAIRRREITDGDGVRGKTLATTPEEKALATTPRVARLRRQREVTIDRLRSLPVRGFFKSKWPTLRKCLAGVFATLAVFFAQRSVVLASQAQQLQAPDVVRTVSPWQRPGFGYGADRQRSAEHRMSNGYPVTDVREVPNPRAKGSWVYDGAHVLSRETIKEIDTLADGVREETGAEVAVVTVPRVGGTRNGEPVTPKRFATSLFNYWGVGDAHRNNGVLVLLCPMQRRVEVEIGYGLERSFNLMCRATYGQTWLQYMEQTRMVPHFKSGDFDSGILTGVREIVERLNTIDADAFDRMAVGRANSVAASSAALGALAIGGASLLYVQNEATKPVCARCGRRMGSKDGAAWSAQERVAESAMVQRLLTDGEVVEQRIGACTFQLYACTNPDCVLHRADATRRDGWGEVDSSTLERMVIAKDTVGVRRTKTGRFAECPQCGTCAVQTETVTLSRATQHSKGQQLRFENCLNCGFADEKVITTPRISKPATGHRYTSADSSRSSGGGGAAHQAISAEESRVVVGVVARGEVMEGWVKSDRESLVFLHVVQHVHVLLHMRYVECAASRQSVSNM